MKKNIFICSLLLIIGIAGFAQTEVTIGAGGYNYCYMPTNFYNRYSYSQSIYLASEIGTGGNITSIAYYPKTTGATRNIRVYMAESPISTFGTASAALTENDFTEVFSGAWTFAVNEWSSIVLNTPFEYSGEANLVVAFIDETGTWVSGGSKSWRGSLHSGSNRGLFLSGSSALNLSSTFSNTVSYIPDIKLTISASEITCPGVSNLTVNETTSHTATISWTAPQDANSFVVEYKKSSQSWDDEAVVTVEGVSETSYQIEDLEQSTSYSVRVYNNCDGDLSSARNISFTTPCEPISELPKIWNFETNNGGGSFPFPECWMRNTASSYNYPYISGASYATSGSRCLYFYSTGNAAILNQIDSESFNINDLQVTFNARTDPYSVSLVLVGVMTDPADPASFDTVAAIQIDETYKEYEVQFADYEGDGTYITLKSGYYSTIYLDDLVLGRIPECPKVQNLVASDITSSSAKVSWTGESESYLVRYRPANDPTSAWNTDDADVYDTFALLSGLSPVTSYIVQVAPDCEGTDETSYRSMTFSTGCAAAYELPFETSFENDAEDACWTTANVGYVFEYDDYDEDYYAYTYPSFIYGGTNARTGSRLLNIGAEEGYTMVLAAPKINANIENLRLKFYAKYFSSNLSLYEPGVFQVGLMTDPTDTATFVLVETVDITSAPTTYSLVTIDFDNAGVTGENHYIAFRLIGAGEDGYSNDLYIDDLTIDEIPQCFEPTGFAVSDITQTTANFTWTSSEDNIKLYYKKISEEEYSYVENISLTDGYYSLQNLDPSSAYNAYVAVVCANGVEMASQTITFNTGCSAISTLPYPQNFDDVQTNSLPDCWNKLNPYNNYPRVTSNSNSMSGKSLEFRANGASYAVLPAFEENISELQISFYTRREAASSGTLQVGYLLNMDTATFVPVFSISSSEIGNNLYHKQIVSFASVEDDGMENVNMAFKYVFTPVSTTSWYWFVDEVVVDYITECPEPTTLRTNTISDTYADLSWRAEGVEEFTLFYKKSSEDEYESMVVELNENGIFTLENLEPSTTYKWYVISNCDENQTASEILTFTTICAGLTDADFPKLWDFEGNNSGGTSNYPLPECWKRVGTSSNNYPYIYSSAYSAAYSGSKYLYFGSIGNAVAFQKISPEININELMLSMYAKSSSSSSGKMIVGFMSDPNTANSFEALDTINVSADYALYEINFSQYEIDGRFVVLKNATSYIYVDDITLAYASDCPSPEKNSVTATNISGHSATIGWTDNDETHTTWIVYYKKSSTTDWENVIVGPNQWVELTGLDSETEYDVYVVTDCGTSSEHVDATYTKHFTTLENCPTPSNLQAAVSSDAATITWTGFADNYTVTCGDETQTVTETTATFTGLLPSTAYTVYVTANCGSADGTSNDATISFTTQCNAITEFPYYESFENGFGCWTTEIISLSTWEISSVSASDGTKSARFPYTEGAIGTLCSPIFDFTGMTNPTLKYDLRIGDFLGLFDSVGVYYRTSATSAWKHINTHEDNNGAESFSNYTFPLPQASSTYQVMFKGYGLDALGVYLDNVVVFDSIGGDIPVVVEPTVATNNAQSVTQTTAVLNGEITNPGNQTITARGFEWKAAAGGTVATVNATGTTTFSANLTGLTAGTEYTFRAYATTAGGNSYGEWKNFTTLTEPVEPCNMPANVTVADFDKQSITLTWDANGAEKWAVQYRKQGATAWTLGSNNITATTYTIGGLEEATIYEYQVQAICDGTTSEWTQVASQTTGIDSRLLESIKLYPNPASDYVEVRVSDNDVKVSRLEVYDVYGKLLNEVEVIDNPTRINVSSLSNGMYYVRVITENGVATKNFVKR